MRLEANAVLNAQRQPSVPGQWFRVLKPDRHPAPRGSECRTRVAVRVRSPACSPPCLPRPGQGWPSMTFCLPVAKAIRCRCDFRILARLRKRFTKIEREGPPSLLSNGFSCKLRSPTRQRIIHQGARAKEKKLLPPVGDCLFHFRGRLRAFGDQLHGESNHWKPYDSPLRQPLPRLPVLRATLPFRVPMRRPFLTLSPF